MLSVFEYLEKHSIETEEKTYLSEHHHVLHYEGDVEQRGKTVEKVELGTKETG